MEASKNKKSASGGEEVKEDLKGTGMSQDDLFPEIVADTTIREDNTPSSPGEEETPSPRTPRLARRGYREEREEGKPEGELISCLSNKKVFVRLIPKESGMFTNPKHEYSGNMAPTSKRVYTVPVNRKGVFVNVLTNEEKAFLEDIMGLEPNALSVYKKQNNYWENYSVTLHKDDNVLDLSDPNQYIDYKVLLANKDYIAPSIEALDECYKATYTYVIVQENEDVKKSSANTNINMRAYMALGAIQNDPAKLAYVIRVLRGGRVTGEAEELLPVAESLMQANTRLFLSIVEDPYMSTKMMIYEALRERIINRVGEYYYMADDNTPLCEKDQEPTLSSAAKYLNAPRHQDVKFSIEARLNRK